MKRYLLFALLVFINLINAENQQQSQLMERLKQLVPPPSMNYSNTSPTSEDRPVNEKVRNIVLKSAPDDVKRLIRIMKDPSCPSHLRPVRILVHGSSGCGKTTLGYIFAQEAGLECKYLSAASLGNEYQNSINASLNRFIDGIHGPCVVLLDQVEILLKRVKDSKEDVPTQVINALDRLARMNVIVWATTNKLEDIEKPLQTRFSGDAIKMRNPRSVELRTEIFLTHMAGITHSLDKIQIANIVGKTSKFSIREIESIIRGAHTFSYDRNSKTVDKQDFDQAIKKIEEARKALENKESWLNWSSRNAKKATGAFVLGGLAGAGTKITSDLFAHIFNTK